MKQKIDYYNEVFTLNELCCFLKLSEKTVRGLLQKGTIKGAKVGEKWRIYKSNVIKYLGA